MYELYVILQALVVISKRAILPFKKIPSQKVKGNPLIPEQKREKS